MFKHIVMWRLDEPEADRSKKENAELIKSALEKLPPLISEISSYEVGINLEDDDRYSDLVLISEFQDEKGFEIYRSHPEHLKVVTLIRSLTKEATFVDFISKS